MNEYNNKNFLEVITKIKNNATGFNNEVGEIVEDFTSVAIKYITDLQNNFLKIEEVYNNNINQLKKEIKEQKDENELELHNYNRVSFIKQQDKEINQAKQQIETLESKLRFVETELTRLKSKPSSIDTINLDYLSISNNNQDNLECQSSLIENENSNATVTEFVQGQCLARIGRKRYKYEDLHQEEKEEYPDNVFISKSGFVLGKSCSVMIEKGKLFCDTHCNKFENITKKPHREKRKTKLKYETHLEDTETYLEDTETHLEDTETHLEDTETHLEDTETHLEDDKPNYDIEIKVLPTFDDIEMYESDSGICYYKDIRDDYKGYLYEITEDEDIGRFIKIEK